MTEHAICYESLSSRTSSSAGLRYDQEIIQTLENHPFQAENQLTTPIPWLPVPLSAFDQGNSAHQLPLHRVDWRLVTNNTAGISLGYANGRQYIASVDGSTLLNGGATPQNYVIQTEPVQVSGRQAPRFVLVFAGDVLSALDGIAGTSTGLDLTLRYSYKAQTYQGLHHFIEFEDQPPNSNPDGSQRTREILTQITQSGTRYQLGIDATGQPVYVEQCGFAAIAPEGAVFIRPDDFGGSAPDQIPSDVRENKASRFRFHPSVFFPAGKAQYVRALTRQHVDGVALDAIASQPLAVLVVDEPVTSSNWLLSVDGQPQLVKLPHPSGSDYRRPRDIWNNVWVPLLSASPDVSSSPAFGPITEAFGGAVDYRFAYADYFRCISIPGTRFQVQSFPA